jgi:hypothetical protein
MINSTIPQNLWVLNPKKNKTRITRDDVVNTVLPKLQAEHPQPTLEDEGWLREVIRTQKGRMTPDAFDELARVADGRAARLKAQKSTWEPSAIDWVEGGLRPGVTRYEVRAEKVHAMLGPDLSRP